MVWATFSSTVIRLINWVMKASVLSSVIVAGLAAFGQTAGFAVAFGDVWAKTPPAVPQAIVRARAEAKAKRRGSMGDPWKGRPSGGAMISGKALDAALAG
jgi:hypothetical protein